MKKSRNKKKLSFKIVEKSHKPIAEELRLNYNEAIENLRNIVNKNAFLDAEYQAHQLIDAEPKELMPRLLLLKNYINSRKFDLAKSIADDILNRFDKDHLPLLECSRLYLQTGDPVTAIELLNKAVTLKPESSICHYNLGYTYDLLGEHELAKNAFDEAIRFDSTNAAAHYGKALLVKDKVSPQYIETLERLLLVKFRQQKLIYLHFAAALSYGESNPDKHFYHLHAGNALIAKMNPWDIGAEKQRQANSRAFFNRQQIEALRDKGFTDYSPIFIASQPRSGTTLLEQIIGAHSATCPVGESNVFNNVIHELEMGSSDILPLKSTLSKGTEFANCLPLLNRTFRENQIIVASGELRIVDKSMSNIDHIAFILLTWPKAKIIHLRRHPLDMILSCYQKLFSGYSGRLSSLENLANSYILSEEHIAYWKTQFPNSIITVDYEELVANNEQVTRELLAFCGLPWEDACLQHHRYIGRSAIINASAMQVRQPLYQSSVGRWKKFAPYLKPAADILGIEI